MSPPTDRLAELITGRHRFLLTGHEHPDGDCLGSQVGLYHLLRALGKEVIVRNPDPPVGGLDFLLEHTPLELLDPDEPLGDIDVVVLLDCSRLDRLGPASAQVRALGATIAVIDHHVGAERGDGEVHMVDPTAPATGTLINALYHRFRLEPSLPAAEGIFVALVSDTGWFRYSNTSAEVLELAAQLTRSGLDPSTIYDRLNRRNRPDSVALLAEGVGRSRVELGGALGVLPVDRQLMARAGRCGVDLDLWMEPLRSVGGIEVVAMLKELIEGTVKLSLRSQHDIDVQAIARQFGGGGHRKAAGATLRCSLAEAERQVLSKVADALEAAGGGK